MGHQGSFERKIQSIEYIDERVIGVIRDALREANEPYRMLVLPDHPTPVSIRTHTGDPVPYVLYDSTKERRAIRRYTEREAELSGIFVPDGTMMIRKLMEI